MFMILVLITMKKTDIVKNCLLYQLHFLRYSVLNENQLKCVSMKIQECEIRTQISSINSDNLFFYPYSVEVNKCSVSCNNINDSYTKLCVFDVVKT